MHAGLTQVGERIALSNQAGDMALRGSAKGTSELDFKRPVTDNGT